MPDAEPAALLRFGPGLSARHRPGALDTVLWFHGYAMDSSIWDDLWDHLPGWGHVGIDLPGHGRSRPIEPGEDLASLAATIARVAADHGVRHLVGLSFGTIIALEVALRAPVGTFDALVLGAPAVAGGPHDEEVERRYEELARLYAERGPGPHMAQLWMRSPPDLFRAARRDPLLWLRIFWLAAHHRWAELGDGAMLALTDAGPGGATRLKDLTASTLVVVGEYDLPAYRRSADLVCAAVPDCRRQDMADAGHLCLIERPEASARVIADHLRQAARKATP